VRGVSESVKRPSCFVELAVFVLWYALGCRFAGGALQLNQVKLSFQLDESGYPVVSDLSGSCAVCLLF
jgi:hypothetical protein